MLKAPEVRGDVLREVEALVVPGGNAWVQWQTLGEPGLDAIREFVRGGKTYVGVCAGAYLATGRPSLPGTLLRLELPFKSTPVRVDVRVVMTNVPGNLMVGNLPMGMGICFEDTPPNVESALAIWAERRLESLGF